jgi:hypothetical protein
MPTHSHLTDELTPEQRADLGDLFSVQDALTTYEAPPSDPAQQTNLLATLTAYMLQQQASATHLSWRDWLRLANEQVRALQAAFWLANALLFVTGLVLAANQRTDTLILGFALIAPLLALGGVALIFRARTTTMRDLELLSPVSPIVLLYMRFLLVLGTNALLSLILLGVIWTQAPQLVLWRLLLLWSGPLLLLLGAALWLSIHYSYWLGTLAPMIGWAALTVLGWRDVVLLRVDVSKWLLWQVNQANPSLLLAALSGCLGLMLIWLTMRQIQAEVTWR